MTPFLQDADCTLYHGDVLDVLAQMPDESVDCVVTSPPYWGLRDYGTGAWEGGDEGCDHLESVQPQRDRPGGKFRDTRGEGNWDSSKAVLRQYGQSCGKCDARRVDQQIGLEPTPELFVRRLVVVFREVRRVLAPHGTCWVNLGDSYATTAPGTVVDPGAMTGKHVNDGAYRRSQTPPGLKPKDLVGIPWRVAFALQADGWWLRSDIVWAKPNPMPESVTDRPTKSHEYVFLLTKQPRYWFDAEAVREPVSPHSEFDRPRPDKNPTPYGLAVGETKLGLGNGSRGNASGRNVRTVWTIATQPYPEAHFATYPEELVRRCVLAGCPERVCRTCGKASERETETSYLSGPTYERVAAEDRLRVGTNEIKRFGDGKIVDTLGWSDCGHNDWRPGLVLDPFMGSGTTAKVARDHGRHSIGIDLNTDYLELAARRLQQQSLFSEPAA